MAQGSGSRLPGSGEWDQLRVTSGEGKAQCLQLGVDSAAVSTVCSTPLLMKVDAAARLKNEAECLGLRDGDNTIQMPAQNQDSEHHRDSSLRPEGTAASGSPTQGLTTTAQCFGRSLG